MCGIAGFFGKPPAGDFVAIALSGLACRGPDGYGVWKDPNGEAVLVHTRLAIIDLTDASSQPMEITHGGVESSTKASATHVLVFNGEIYNYRELRTELEALGETFRSDGDTEVLLRLLIREGIACLPKLAGMFAFGFWDVSKACGLLVRDPLGIKPVYYRDEAGTFAFASQSKILSHGDDPVDPTALRDYFLWGSVPAPQTIHLPVRQLPAGHLIKWEAGQASILRWHRLSIDSTQPKVPRSRLKKVADNYIRRTRVALEESLQRHLVSDVPVGIFLSGGIDSTSILALTRDLLGTQADIRTFSIGFDDPEFDESDIARKTADHFGAHHTEWKMTSEDGEREIPKFLDAMDQPGIDGFNTWCVSKLAAREGMKVVLSGLGGDEIFGGYATFRRVPLYHQWYDHLGLLRQSVARSLELRPAGSPVRRMAAFLQGDGGWVEAYHAQRGIFTRDEAELLARTFSTASAQITSFDIAFPTHPKDIVSLLELTIYLRQQLLRDSDVYSMAHGLELRVPFVDTRLIESIFKIPASTRFKPGKRLLVEAIPEIPAWVLEQPKRGFRFPFQTWMEGQFGSILQEAKRQSPINLNAWYRTWAVAAVLKALLTSS